MKLKFLLCFFLTILILGAGQIFAAEDAPTLVLQYSFEDNILDGSGNDNDATALGTSAVPVYGEADGRKGKYLDLSGNTDNGAAALFIRTPDSILASTDAFTVTGWAKINTAAGRMQIVNQPADDKATKQFLMKWYQESSGNPFMSGVVVPGSWYHSKPQDMLNWFHFAIVADPAKDTMDIWYDGVHAKGISAAFGDTVAPFFFGAFSWGIEANDGFYDEIYVYKGALSEQEIKANISAADNLVLHYGFEDELTDGSGNENDATALGTSGVPVYSETDGLKGKYLDLSGNTDNGAAALFIQTPDSLLSSTEPFTLTGWTKINTAAGRMQIVNQPADDKATKQFLMKWYQESSGNPFMSGVVEAGSWYHSKPQDMLNWFHFAIVADPANDTLDIWYDGVHAKGISAAFGDTVAPFFFGAFSWGIEANDGFFDEISLYNKLLTGEEITELYMANKPCDPIDVTVVKTEIELQVASIEGATYQWFDCADGSAITGATDSLYAPAESGEFKVTVTVGECEETSECTSITIITCDPIDVAVTKNDTALYVKGMEGASYQWIDCADGSAISGATDTLYAPAASGDFKVAITLSAECADTSECTSITINTGINPTSNLGISVYPNPVSDVLTIDLGAQARGEIEIINLVGQRVLQASIERQHARLDLSAMASGVYLLKVSVEDGSAVRRIIKQ